MIKIFFANVLLTAALACPAAAADFDGRNKGIPPPSDPYCYGNCPDDDTPSDDTPPPPPPQQPAQPQQPPKPPVPVTPPQTNPLPPPPVTPQPYYPPPPPQPLKPDMNFYFNQVFPLAVCVWAAEASDKNCTQKKGGEALESVITTVGKDMLMDEGAKRLSLKYKYPITYYEAAKAALDIYQRSLDSVKLLLSKEVGAQRYDPHFEWMTPAQYAQNLRLMMENEKLIREWREAARQETATAVWRDAGDSTLEYQCGPACEKLKRELLGKDVFGGRKAAFK